MNDDIDDGRGDQTRSGQVWGCCQDDRKKNFGGEAKTKNQDCGEKEKVLLGEKVICSCGYNCRM